MCVVFIIVCSLFVYRWFIVILGVFGGRLVSSVVKCVMLWLFLFVWLM